MSKLNIIANLFVFIAVLIPFFCLIAGTTLWLTSSVYGSMDENFAFIIVLLYVAIFCYLLRRLSRITVPKMIALTKANRSAFAVIAIFSLFYGALVNQAFWELENLNGLKNMVLIKVVTLVIIDFFLLLANYDAFKSAYPNKPKVAN